LVADRELVPDLWELVDLHVDEIERLFEASGAVRAAPTQPRAPRAEESRPGKKSGKKSGKRSTK
jgi:diacylglycerol O-acyltransferase